MSSRRSCPNGLDPSQEKEKETECSTNKLQINLRHALTSPAHNLPVGMLLHLYLRRKQEDSHVFCCARSTEA